MLDVYIGDVSRAVEPLEFEREIREWLRRIPSVSLREQRAWRGDLLVAIAKLPYVKSIRHVEVPAQPYHVDIRVVIDLPTGSLEPVWADLVRLWSHEVAYGLRATHTFVNFPEGFELRMACSTGTQRSFAAIFRVTVRKK